MRFVLQVAKDAKVTIDGEVKGRIDKGLVALIGVSDDDTREIADKMIKKMVNLRIFPDENGKTNLNLESAGGSLLLVSQFTLYADISRGNRPGFTRAGKPDHAKDIYHYIIDSCRELGYEVGTGEFGADMEVSLTNMGPFTIIMDSDDMGL